MTGQADNVGFLATGSGVKQFQLSLGGWFVLQCRRFSAQLRSTKHISKMITCNYESNMKTFARALIVICGMMLWAATVTSAFAFNNGDRVMAASAGVNVRDNSFTTLFPQVGGVHGTIIGGPTYTTAGGYTGNWYQVNWDSGPPLYGNVGWSADYLLSLAPSAGDVSEPSFSASYYTSGNIFWESGYAPASTSPPNPQLGSAFGNCTWYACGRMLQLGFSSTQVNTMHGNARDWASEAQANGISVDTTPTVHSIAQSVSQDHVAIVESVNNGGTITVTESSAVQNSSSPWDFLWHHRTVSPSWFENFIHLSGVSTISVTVQPSISGCSFTVDGTGYTTAHAFTWVSGSGHTIATTSPQSGGSGIQYVWSGWSDGGAISHTVNPTVNGTTYTANFATQYYLTMGYGTGGSSVSPGGGWWSSGASVGISETPASGYSFSSWTGSGTGSYSGSSASPTITMNGPITELANFTPNPVNISVTVQPSISGCSFTVDGTGYTTAHAFTWVSGSGHTIATTSPQSGGSGIQYVWSGWSDGGAISHTVNPTVNDTTYTASFTTQYYLTMSMGSGGSSVSPASGWGSSGAGVSINATAASGYSFSSWTGSGSGSYTGSSQSSLVTMNAPITETASFTVIAALPGSAVAWGDSTYGQCNVPRDLTNVVSIAAGYQHSLALKADGAVVAWGENDFLQTNVPPGLSNVKAIAAGWGTSLALKGDGTVKEWGWDGGYGITNTANSLANITAVSACWDCLMALKGDNTVFVWGHSTHGETNVPAGLTDVVAVSGGGFFCMALKRDGTVVTWGTNAFGQTNTPASLSGVKAIAAGGDHCLALKSNGTVVAWGLDTSGQTNVPPSLTNAVAVWAGG